MEDKNFYKNTNMSILQMIEKLNINIINIIKNSSLGKYQTLAKNNWVLPFEYEDIKDLETDEEIIEMFSNDNNQELRNIINKILELKSDSINVEHLKQSLEVYEHGYYASCCFSIAPIIERILEDKDDKTCIKIYKLYKKVNDKYRNLPVSQVPCALLIGLKIFIKNYTANKPFNEEEPVLLNRNWLLHGRMNQTITKKHCLQLYSALCSLSIVTNEQI